MTFPMPPLFAVSLDTFLMPVWLLSVGVSAGFVVLLILWGLLWLVSRRAAAGVWSVVKEGILVWVTYIVLALLALTILAGALGLLTLYSAVNAGADNSLEGIFARQLVWYGVGFIIMVVVFLIDYKVYERWAYLFFILCLILLVAVLVYGKQVSGSQRWLVLGPVSFQPSELVKLSVITLLARYYSKVINQRRQSRNGKFFSCKLDSHK